jgi:hypothetical protein
MSSPQERLGVLFLSAIIFAFGSYGLSFLNVSPQLSKAAVLDSDPNLVGNYDYGTDGTSVAVTIPDSNALDVTGPLTLSVWFKATAGTSGANLISKNNSYALGVQGSGGTGIYMTIRGSLSTDAILKSVTTFLNSGWHHLTGVYDGSNLLLYMDGVLIGSQATTRTSIDATASDLLINESNYATVDEAKIFSRALTAAEISSLFNDGTVTHPATAPSAGGGTTGGGSTGGGSTPPPPPPTTVTVVDVRSTAPAPVQWTPPIGIPEPSFGIRETHYMYQLQSGETCSTHPKKCFNFGSGPQAYHDAGNGPYSHYVDNTAPNATDSNNPFGNHALPRKTFPDLNTLPAGSVVEIHGGPYVGSVIGSSQHLATQNGTKDQPIFFRGYSAANKPVLDTIGSFMIRGPYIIVENLKFKETTADIRPWFASENASHISFRSNESTGSRSSGGAAGVFTGDLYVDNIVFYNNVVKLTTADEMIANNFEYENVGFAIVRHSSYVWIVDNDISGVGSDAAGAGHAAEYTAKYYFIGRNKMYHTGENAVDVKEVDHVVISQNTMYDFVGPGTDSDGTAVVVHYGPQLPPKNAWILYNEIYNAIDNGIQVGGDVLDDVYIIGNNVHDIKNPAKTANGFISWNSNKIYLVGNNFTNVDHGIVSASTGAVGGLYVKNNTIGPLTNPVGYHLKETDRLYQSVSVIDNNKFVSAAKIFWGVDYGLAGFKTATGQCASCVEGSGTLVADPAIITTLNQKFRDAFGYDLNLSGGGSLPPPTQTNGVCGASVNTCSAGTLLDQTDTSTNALWQCLGSGTGAVTASCSIAFKPGDYDKNGVVNSIDISYMAPFWNQYNSTYDLTGDGYINTLDYAVLVRNF